VWSSSAQRRRLIETQRSVRTIGFCSDRVRTSRCFYISRVNVYSLWLTPKSNPECRICTSSTTDLQIILSCAAVYEEEPTLARCSHGVCGIDVTIKGSCCNTIMLTAKMGRRPGAVYAVDKALITDGRLQGAAYQGSCHSTSCCPSSRILALDPRLRRLELLGYYCALAAFLCLAFSLITAEDYDSPDFV
jgi:hypothetical protein